MRIDESAALSSQRREPAEAAEEGRVAADAGRVDFPLSAADVGRADWPCDAADRADAGRLWGLSFAPRAELDKADFGRRLDGLPSLL